VIDLLDEIMREIENANGPITVKELAKRVGVEESALPGMLEFLEKKGRLSLVQAGEWEQCQVAACEACALRRWCAEGGKEGDE
jgi:predicted transcriptional regulator of viral defense system